jgi:hypothetical protein
MKIRINSIAILHDYRTGLNFLLLTTGTEKSSFKFALSQAENWKIFLSFR